jgi:hypothetical protein
MAQVRRGRVGIVVVFRLDRLARSLSHLAQMLAEFQLYRTALVCPGQGIDTSNTNPAAQLKVNILAAVAQFERELIVERESGLASLRLSPLRNVREGSPFEFPADIWRSLNGSKNVLSLEMQLFRGSNSILGTAVLAFDCDGGKEEHWQ